VAGIDYRGFEAGDSTPIWRYMTIGRLESLLAEGLYFASATQFDDAFEGAVTEAEITRREQDADRFLPDDPATRRLWLNDLSQAFEDLRRMTKLSCWHASTGFENVAMWDRYLTPFEYGVAVVSTVGSLKAALQEFRLEPQYGEEPIVVGKVRYIDYAAESMEDTSTTAVFMHKRIEYSDEREVRAILSLRMASEFGVPIPDEGVFVGVDLSLLIHEIRLWPKAQDTDESAVQQLIGDAGVSCEVRRSSLSSRPTY